MPQVDIKKIKNRMTVARSHAVEVQKKLMQSSIGQKVNILFESMLQSYTDNFFKGGTQFKEYFQKLSRLNIKSQT